MKRQLVRMLVGSVVICGLLAAVAGCAALPGSERQTTAAGTELQKILQPLVDEWRTVNGVPGLALVISLADGSLVRITSGFSDLKSEKRMAGTELFDAASLTETFVAAAILQLAEEGKLSLEDPIGRYVGSVAGGETITVRQVLSHQSGIAEIGRDPESFQRLGEDMGREWSLPELVALAAEQEPYFAPGTAYRYTDSNYVVAAAIAEAASGMDLAALLRQRFFDRLVLENTFFAGRERAKGSFVSGYLSCRHELAPSVTALYGEEVFCQAGYLDLKRIPGYQEASWRAGASGVVSTAEDLLRWARALYGGQVLSAASLEEMLAFDPSRGNYGLGAMEFQTPSSVAWGHTGGALGMESILVYEPGQSVVLVTYANAGDTGNLTYLTDSVLSVLAASVPREGAAERTIEELRAALGEDEATVRRQAAADLGRKGPEAAAAAQDLIEMLAGDPEWQVREAAAMALGQIGPESLVAGPLREAALNDVHERVQWAAQLALGMLKE